MADTGANINEELEIQTNWEECTTTFDAMDLKEELLRGIYAYGFEKPSAIQQRAIKPMLLKHDVIAQAQSGNIVVIILSLNSKKLPEYVGLITSKKITIFRV